MTREEKIEQLIQYDLKYRMTQQEVRQQLYHGFIGYRHYTDKELDKLFKLVIGHGDKKERT